ncbi:MAG: LytTR family DNA-binding domain-containing protein [Erysipelotrichaceae bacterium]
MFNIAIIDDEKFFIEEVFELLNNQIDDCHIASYDSASSFLMANQIYDLAVIDINMPKMDGIELSKRIKDNIKYIIFLTTNEQRMQDAFDYHVMGYVFKKEMHNKLVDLVKSIINKENKTINFTIDRLVFPFKEDDIYYIQKEVRRFYLYTQKQEYIVTEKSLESLRLRLSNAFSFINQSCIVNIDHIARRDDDVIMLDNGVKLYISRRFKKNFIKEYFIRVMEK